MSAVNYFFSASATGGADRAYTAANSPAAGKLNQGTATYSSDPFELRITTGATNGPASITKRDVENFLLLCQRWLHDQGGSSTDSGQGLDYLITATSGTVGVP